MSASDSEVGRRVAMWRRKLGYSQAELAALVDGLDQTKVSRIEGGGRRLSGVELAGVAAALRVDPLDLLEDRPLAEAVAVERSTPGTTAMAATRRAIDVLRTWRALEADGFGVDVGERPQLTTEGNGPVEQGRHAAEELRRLLSLDDAPLRSLVDIGAAVGMVVVLEPLDGGADGVCVGDGPRCVAVINTSSWGSRQRFTLAHEVAHWLFGDVDDRVREDEDVFRGTSDAGEARANAFAAHVLVPDRVVERLRGAAFDDAVRTAFLYRVSLQTLSWRIQNTIPSARDLAVQLRRARPLPAAMDAGWGQAYVADAGARNRTMITLAFEAAARRAAEAGALSERHLAQLVRSAVDLPGGPL